MYIARNNKNAMTINEIRARLEQNPSEDERRELQIELNQLLKAAEQAANWRPEFDPLKVLREIIAKAIKRRPNKGKNPKFGPNLL